MVAAWTARSHWYLNLAHPGKRFRLARGRILQDGPANTLVAAALATLLAGVIAMTSLLTPPTLSDAAGNVSCGGYLHPGAGMDPTATWDRLDRSLHGVPGLRSASLGGELPQHIIDPAECSPAYAMVANCDHIQAVVDPPTCRDGDSTDLSTRWSRPDYR